MQNHSPSKGLVKENECTLLNLGLQYSHLSLCVQAELHTSLWFYPAPTETPISPTPFTHFLHHPSPAAGNVQGRGQQGPETKFWVCPDKSISVSSRADGFGFSAVLFLGDSAKNSEHPIVTSGSSVPSSKLGCKSPWDLITNFHPALLCVNKSHQPCSAVFNVEKGAAVLFTSCSMTKSVSPGN